VSRWAPVSGVVVWYLVMGVMGVMVCGGGEVVVSVFVWVVYGCQC
jgi:hypothetical protein